MSGNLNINRNVTDQFYRYKMPRLIAKVEGKGNGIKTVIVNMIDIAKALARPASYPTKFFGCELGAQTQMDAKNERYIVNGAHDSNRLQDMLDGFIRKFVLCPECDNPETVLKVSAKRGVIGQSCLACGHQGQLDMRHKLTTFILRNPPTEENLPGGMTAATSQQAAALTSKAKPSKKSKKDKKDGGDGDGEVGDDEIPAPPPPAADGDEEDDENLDWGEDTELDRVQERMAELSTRSLGLTQTDDFEKTLSERLDIFYEFVKDLKSSGRPITSTEVVARAEQLEVKEKAPLMLAELLFDENMLAAIKQYRPLFVKLCHESPKAQKYLLGGFEQVVHKEKLTNKVPHLLKAMYDLDILDEEVIIEWADKVSKKYVPREVSAEIRDKAAPFVKWLKEADEDSEESEEDLEVAFSDGVTKPTTATVKVQPAQHHADNEDDDLNIDDI